MNRHLRAILKGLAFILSLAAVMYLAKAAGLERVFDKVWIDENIRGRGLYGELLFVGFAAAFTALGLPRQVVAFLGGYAYGALLGALLGVAGTTVGAALTLYYARFMGGNLVARRYGRRLERLNCLLREAPFSATLVIRFLPVGSNLLTNLVAGVTHVPVLWFLAGSMLGYTPQTLIFALLGSGGRVDSAWRTGLSVVLFLVSSGLGYPLYRRYRVARLAAGDENGGNGEAGKDACEALGNAAEASDGRIGPDESGSDAAKGQDATPKA